MNTRSIWVYWFITDVTLAIGLMLWPAALFVSMLVVGVHSVHCFGYRPHVFAFPMQVRLVYLGLLILGQLPYMTWINWVQLAGTTAFLLVGYCPLARLLSMMPWNRNQPISWRLFRVALFTPPVSGSILDVVSPKRVE